MIEFYKRHSAEQLAMYNYSLDADDQEQADYHMNEYLNYQKMLNR